MSAYARKLLELKSIENKLDRYFLHLRISFEQDIEIFFEVDEYTAENLKSFIKFDSAYKYRLSFNNSWDVLKKQPISILTQTYREQSSRIYFPCSEDYITKLTSIKNCQHIDHLSNLNFISTDIASIHEVSLGEKQEQYEDISLGKYANKLALAPITIMSIIFVFLFGFWGHISVNKTSFHQKVLAQSMGLEHVVPEETNEILNSNDSIIVEAISFFEPTIPFVKLNETLTYNIPKGNVALTFDDGPSKYSTEIMDVLKKYNVGGTFFFTGTNIKKYPDRIKYIKSNGYSIGSHSMTHSDMKTLTYENQEIEIVESIKLLEQITHEKIVLFRPPYGSFTTHVKDLINEHQYKMVLWNNDTKDWKTRDADKIFNYIQNSDVSGSIILLHESQAVIDSLPRIIEYLQELDLKIVNLK